MVVLEKDEQDSREYQQLCCPAMHLEPSCKRKRGDYSRRIHRVFALKRLGTGFAGPYANHLLEVGYENLAVPDLARAR
jgi:hypothetical protein